MKKVISIIVLVVIISCSKDRKIPENFDYGNVENGIYQNNFFNMTVPFNPDWKVQNKEQLNNIIKAGEEVVAGDDKELKSMMKASMINTAYLLTIFKHEVGAAVEYNPSFMVIAENTKNLPGIKRGSDYLFHAKKTLLMAQIKYTIEENFTKKKIGSLDFDVMKAEAVIVSKTVQQEYLTTILNGFSLSFILSYTTEAEKNELYKIINKIKI